MISVAYVDDDPHIALMVCLLCQRQGGITMHGYTSGQEMLDMLSHSPVEVIISDYDMPGINGIDLLATLRSRGDLTPFILFTGMEEAEVIGKAVNRYPSAWILVKGCTIHGQLHQLVTMIHMAARYPAVHKG